MTACSSEQAVMVHKLTEQKNTKIGDEEMKQIVHRMTVDSARGVRQRGLSGFAMCRLGAVCVGAMLVASSAFAGLWTPADRVTELWLDADDAGTITSSGGTVSQWDDKSGNGNHATQDSTSAQPAYDGVNSVLTFDSDIMKVTNDPFNGLQNFAVIAVQKWSGSSKWGNASVAYHGEGSNGWQLRQKDGNYDQLTFTRRGTNGDDDPVPASTVNSSDHIVVGLRQSSTEMTIRHNGTDTYNTSGDTGSISYQNSNQSSIGGRYQSDNWGSPGGYLNGTMREVVVIVDATDEDVETVEGYLAHKWDLADSLPADHPYKDSAPGYASAIPFSDLVASNITTTAASLYATVETNLTSATVLWNTEDKGDTNLAVWVNSTSATGTTPGVITGNATNLTQDTQYFFRFFGVDATANGWSDVETFATALTVAQTPVFTNVTASFNSVTLEWTDNSVTETGFLLQRSTNGTEYATVALLNADTTSHEDEGLQTLTQYFYKLAATNDLNESSSSFSVATNATTLYMPDLTIFQESADTDWNNAANWNGGIPSLSQEAVIEAGKKASANSTLTPTYTGGLTIGNGSEVEIRNVVGAENAYGTGTITFDGGTLDIQRATDLTLPPVVLTANGGTLISDHGDAGDDDRIFGSAITGSGQLTILTMRDKQYTDFAVSNSFSGGLLFQNSDRSSARFKAAGSAGAGDVTVIPRSDGKVAALLVEANNVFADTATLTMGGIPYANGDVPDSDFGSGLIDMNSFTDTINLLVVNSWPRPAGDYGRVDTPASVDYEVSWVKGDGVLTVLSDVGDTTPPTLSFNDDQGGGLIVPQQAVTYTLSFSEPLLVWPTTNDFENALPTGVIIESVTPAAVLHDPVDFLMVVKATEPGALKMQVKSGASFNDLFGNALVVPVADDDTLTVSAAPPIQGELGIWKPWANGGINPATTLAWAAGDTYRLVFVTSAETTAESTEITTYNTFVQGVAASSTAFPDLGNVNWNIVGSTSAINAMDNTSTNPDDDGTGVAIFMMDGETSIAHSNADLWDGISNAVTQDENDQWLKEDRVFTGTKGDGTQHDQVLGTDPDVSTGRTDRDGTGWMEDYRHGFANLNSVYAISDLLTLQSNAPAGTLIILR